MADYTIRLDAWEFLQGCTTSEKEEVYEHLVEEFGESNKSEALTGAITPTETDLQEVLLEIWNRRSLLTNEHRDLLLSLTTASTIQA